MREEYRQKKQEEKEIMKKRGEDFVRKSMQVKDDPLGHMCISAYVHVFKSVNV